MKIQDVLEGFGRNPAYMSPMDYERDQQRQMDADRREFKRQELQHELGHEEKWNDRPRMVGMYFYDIKPGQEERAAMYGIKKTKSGKWAKTKYDKSGRTFDFQKNLADKEFGPGKFWSPNKESVGESASAGATGSGSIASVANPGGKKRSQVGSLFGGTFGETTKQTKKKSKVLKR